MTDVVVDITMSLDGFVTGPNVSPGNGLGDGGMSLHDWVFDGNDDDQLVLSESLERTGAVLIGRNTFDVIDGPGGWNEKMGFGGPREGIEPPPNFVVTHKRPAKSRLEDTGVAGSFEFVTEGLEAAVARARDSADGKDVTLMGGNLSSSCLAEGLVTDVRIHLAPIVLGAGTPLFSEPSNVSLKQVSVISTPLATHLHYRVVP
jgi:dihydrofolate reductase